MMYNNIGDIIAHRRRELGMNQGQLAAKLNSQGFQLSYQAVSKWENGSTIPNAKQFLAVCDALDIDDIRGVFSCKGEGLLAGLNREGRKLVMDYAQLLRDSGRYSPEPEVPIRSLPLYSLAVSAGTGQFLDGEDYEMIEVDREVPDGANFGVRVSGDSMEPQYHDGQTIWIRQQRSLMTGEIGIFLYDGSAYLKQLVAHDDALALHSLNPQYSDIVISPELPLRVLGKVMT
jgi:SOS-response transcriptional repressor LexA